MKHLKILNSPSDEELQVPIPACTDDWCAYINASSCTASDWCSFDFGAGCATRDSCGIDFA